MPLHNDGTDKSAPYENNPKGGSFMKMLAKAAERKQACSITSEGQVESRSGRQDGKSQAVERSREARELNTESRLDRSTEINEAPERTSVSQQDPPILSFAHLYEEFKAEKDREEREASTSQDKT